MLQFPNIDPVAIAIGPLKVHWYGLMYLFGFAVAFLIGSRRAKTGNRVVTPEQMGDMVFYGAMGVVFGARIGYIVFYKFSQWLQDPTLIFRVWEGGMSFHGGLIGTAIALYLYGRSINRHFLDMVDYAAPLATLGLFFGRIGNFIGADLYGRVTTMPWGMVFPGDDSGQPRHPSQLYEAFLEGICLFIILYWYSGKPRPRGAVIGAFVMLYGIFRFFVEFFREPDSHIGFDLFGWVTRGQILCFVMIVVGAALMAYAYRQSHIPRFDHAYPNADTPVTNAPDTLKKQTQKRKRKSRKKR